MSLPLVNVARRAAGRLEALVALPRHWRAYERARRKRDDRTVAAGESRRTFSYRRELVPNPVLAEAERETRDLAAAVAGTGLSMGYPAWNLLYYSLLCGLP